MGRARAGRGTQPYHHRALQLLRHIAPSASPSPGLDVALVSVAAVLGALVRVAIVGQRAAHRLRGLHGLALALIAACCDRCHELDQANEDRNDGNWRDSVVNVGD